MLFAVVAVVLAVLVVLAVTRLAFEFPDVGRNYQAAGLLLAAAAGIAALVGWARSRPAQVAAERERDELRTRLGERERGLAGAREQAESQRVEHERALGDLRTRHARDLAARDEGRDEREAALTSQREELENRLGEREKALRREHALLSRVERARRAEQSYSRQLRGEIADLQRAAGPLGETNDVPGLALRLALSLLEGEKGLLLSRRDADDDGDLDLLAHVGYRNDPEHSALVQRFASEVLARDATVREDTPRRPEGSAPSPADDEIENLVAIPMWVRDQFSGVVICANRPGGFGEFDEETLLSLGDQASTALDNARLHDELRGSYLSTVALLADAMEAKDPFLRGHSDEVAAYVAAVARRLDLEPQRREELVFASLLPDVGKIGISERILLKPSSLTREERQVVELHPRIGSRLITRVAALSSMALSVLHHHERWDGSGYPAGLKGEDIPLEARIICVADCFSAMTSERPYSAARTAEEACAELESCSGSQFDPSVVEAFVAEVRARPPSGEPRAQDRALEDPELQAARTDGEPVLGFGSYALTDSLTLLYSHRYFHETALGGRMATASAERPLAVVLLELEGVTELNRIDGYAAGDEAIRRAAQVLQRTASRLGGTAARYSGRRLALVAPDHDGASVETLASQISTEVSQAIGLAVRCGAAAWRPGDTAGDLMARARLALSTAGAAR